MKYELSTIRFGPAPEFFQNFTSVVAEGHISTKLNQNRSTTYHSYAKRKTHAAYAWQNEKKNLIRMIFFKRLHKEVGRDSNGLHDRFFPMSCAGVWHTLICYIC